MKKKQYLLIFICCLAYCANYMCRSSYGANINCFRDEYGISLTEAGLVSTLFFFTYGVGQVINSFISPHYNKRLSISLPLIGLGILTLLNFFKFDFSIYKYIWIGCGICSSFLWSSIIKLTSDNIDDDMTDAAALGFVLAVSIGTIATYLLSSLFASINQYRFIFLVSAVFSIISAIIYFILVKDFNYSPKMVDQSIKEKGSGFYEKMNPPKRGMLFLIFFMFSATLCNIVMDSLLTWTPPILKDEFSFNNSLSIFFGVMLPLIRSFGGAFNTLLEKRKVKHLIILSMLMVVALISFSMIVLSLDKNLVILFIVSAIVSYVPYICLNNLLTSIIPLKIRSYYDSGIIAGIVDGFAYAGSALSTFAVPLLVERTNWTVLFIAFIGISSFILLISVILLLCFRKKHEYHSFL